jgi:hypothetical protein
MPLDDLVLLAMLLIVAAIFVIILLIVIIIFKVNKYSEESVIQRWNTMLPGLANLGPEFLDRVENELKTRKIVSNPARRMIPRKLSSTLSDELILCKESADYCCYIGYNIIGGDLYLHWLVQDNSDRSIYRIPFFGPLLKKNTFALISRVISFTTAVHSAVLNVTDQIIDEQNVDRTKVNRKSSGKFGPI